jgi:hypothetical protein
MEEQQVLTDLEKYELVNSCETVEQLQTAILKCAEGSTIVGRTDYFNASKMAAEIPGVVKDERFANVLTRKWGIRQQALYLAYYKHPIYEIEEVDIK